MMELRGTGRNRPGFKAAQHSLTRHKNVPGEPRNPRLVWVGRDLKEHFIPTPCHGRDTSHCPRLLPLPGIQGSPSCSGKAEQQHQGGSAEPTLLGKRVPKETAPASTAKSGGGRIRNVQRHFGISYTIPTGGFAAIPYSPELHLWALLTGRSSHGITPWMQLEGAQGGHPMGSPHGCSWKGPKEVIPWDHPMDAAGRDPRRSSHGITPCMQLEGTQGGHPMGSPHGCSWKGPKEVIPWDHPMDAAGRDPRRSSHGITPCMQLEGTQGGHSMGSPHGCSWKGHKEVIPWDHPMDAAGRDPRSPRCPPRAAELGRNSLYTTLGSPRLEKPSKVTKSKLGPTPPWHPAPSTECHIQPTNTNLGN
ncbi:uncharacterized protein LOC108961679 isoform X10 [Serinus canaria]|uniref:uncharacterized protein LOC108961679 isoform X10 n=1 Tax=Serinus canaria TaxID=9135 RepID=UPI0021CCD85D|nr:uncharacterized protein LOC108961679 isoform X10 [Serinus canaria]